MYEKHFNLNKRIFHGTPADADIFVSPQTAASLARMKKALAAPDTIIAVTGHAGVGKSTLVSRALHAINGKNAVVRIGEKKLDPDDVLEMLLVALGTAKAPAGTIQKLRFFRQLLDSLKTQNSRVFIVIEDTAKTCPDTLSELEALTASDTGFSCGANILLMANGSLDEFLSLPLLARFDQRARLRESVQPFTPEELRGYLNHSFRLAGGEFETIFAEGATELLHTFGGGVARAVNKIVESVLTAAAQHKADTVDLALLKRAAMDELGLAAESGKQTQAGSAPEEIAEHDEEPIAELVEDTLTELEVLTPELVGGATPPGPDVAESSEQENAQAALPAENKDVPDWDRDPTLAELRPDLDALEQAMAVAQGRRSDSQGEEGSNPDASKEAPDGKAAGVPEITLDNSIQKKVDQAEIEMQRVREEEEARRAANANESIEDDDVQAASAQAVAADKHANVAANDADNSKLSHTELTQIATDLAKAKTIEDVDDKLAETLFGEELNLIAANVAKAKTIENVDDKLAETLFGEEIKLAAAQVIANLPAAQPTSNAQQISAVEPAKSPHEQAAAPQAPETNNAAPSTVAAPTTSAVDTSTAPAVVAPATPAVDTSTASPTRVKANAPGMSQSQRLRTVRALNTSDSKNPAPANTSRPASDAASPPPLPASDQPKSIEEQISTSVTQSLKALDKNSIPIADGDDDDDDTQKSGFFNRFRLL